MYFEQMSTVALVTKSRLRPAANSHSEERSAHAQLTAVNGQSDLQRVNVVVEASLDSWNLPSRVKRLALPSLLFSELDLEQMSVVLLEGEAGDLAVATWGMASGRDAAAHTRAVLLHGLYVVPGAQRRGFGSALLELASHWMLARGFDGIIARVWRESEAFFYKSGFTSLPRSDTLQPYPRRLWRPLH